MKRLLLGLIGFRCRHCRYFCGPFPWADWCGECKASPVNWRDEHQKVHVCDWPCARFNFRWFWRVGK